MEGMKAAALAVCTTPQCTAIPGIILAHCPQCHSHHHHHYHYQQQHHHDDDDAATVLLMMMTMMMTMMISSISTTANITISLVADNTRVGKYKEQLQCALMALTWGRGTSLHRTESCHSAGPNLYQP